jgi:predicted GIY-YIG superfamily endonuclease
MAVYLIHFDRPIGDPGNPRGQARHYIGYADDLERRLAQHRSGNGSALMAAVARVGIPWQVVRTWPDGDRTLERRLKRQKHAWRFCPLCRAERRGNGR